MTHTKQFSGYAGVRRDEQGSVINFSYSETIEGVKSSLSKQQEGKSVRIVPDKIDLEDKTDSKLLAIAMNRTLDALQSQFELLFLTSVRSHFAVARFNEEIVKPIVHAKSIVEEADGTSIYGLSQEQFRKIPVTLEWLHRIGQGMDALPAALLMSIVAVFDSNTADVVRDMLTIRPASLQAGTRTALVKEVLESKSIDEFKQRIISDEIYLFSRGSHEEQIEYIKKNFHISIMSHWKRWADFIEVFERPNLVAHGEKTFTQRYVDNCKKHSHKGSEKLLGTPIELSQNYLRQSLEILTEFGILLVFSLWRKHLPAQEKEAFVSINQIAFKIISTKKYIVPIRIVEYALGLKNTTAPESVKRMMIVNLASAYKHNKDDAKCIEVLDSVDWSASSDPFKICVHALKGDVSLVTRLMPILATASLVRSDDVISVHKDDYRDWPVFDFIRSDASFKATFLEVYGEPLMDDQQSGSVNLMEGGISVDADPPVGGEN